MFCYVRVFLKNPGFFIDLKDKAAAYCITEGVCFIAPAPAATGGW